MKCLSTATLLILVFAVPPMVASQNLTDSGGERILREASEKERTMTQRQIREAYGKLPLSFEANDGQTAGEVKFLTRGQGYTLFLTATEAVLALQTPTSRAGRNPHDRLAPPPETQQGESNGLAIVRMKLLDGNGQVRVAGVDELPGKTNYFAGNDPKNWRRNIPTYARVLYQDVYAGVDLIYYSTRGQLQYDFVVAPGASPEVIRLVFDGVTLGVDADGALVGALEGGEVRVAKPVIYQQLGGARVPIRGDWVLAAGGQAGFQVGEYDKAEPLVIDPVLSYSTYLGGSLDDVAAGVAVDSLGNAYVTGLATSANFPITGGALQTTLGDSRDGFVTKLDPSGSTVVYSTYLGGSSSDGGSGIALDGEGNAYVTGSTQSADFPTTPGALQFGGDTDAFVTKLDPTGSVLVYSTHLGGSARDEGARIAVDAVGSAYVTGATQSVDFPTTATAFQTAFGGVFDAFVTKLHPTGLALDYSTYLGGSSAEVGADIAVDALGSAYVTGTNRSSDFPVTPGAVQSSLPGSSDSAFVTKLDPTGSALVYSTYLGGTANDFGAGIAVDSLGHAYVTGGTQGGGFPTTAGAFQTTFGGTSDSFVTKLDPTGSSLSYSTFLGGSDNDWGDDIAVDALGNAYLIGSTRSSDFPTAPGAFQSALGGEFDAFVAKLDAAGSSLVHSTYFGGSSVDFGSGIALDPAASAYVTGFTVSTDFPTTAGAFQTAFGGLRDGFVAKIAALVLAPPTRTGRVSGGGSIHVTDGIATFGFVVQRRTPEGPIGGNLQYVDHARRVTVRSQTFTSLTITGNTAIFEGTCTINRSPCTFAVTVTDEGEPGANDTFIMTVSSAPSEGGVLRGGNIQIRE